MSKQELNIDLIKKTLPEGAKQVDYETLIHLSKEYNLDPLKKEIYLLIYGGKASILTSRDGYLKIANTDPNFDGIESDAVYIGDKLTKREDGSILIEYGEEHLKFDKTKLSGAFCNIFRKDRSKPVAALVALGDYLKGSPIWKQYTSAMIIKVAESMALKRAFALSGLVTSEEVEESEEDLKPMPIDINLKNESPYITKEQLDILELELVQVPETRAKLLKYYRIEAVDQLPKVTFMTAYNHIKDHKKKQGL